MYVTHSLSIVVISMIGLVGIALMVDLVLDYVWNRKSQTMHAKTPDEK